MIHTLKDPAIFEIKSGLQSPYVGGAQTWYREKWQQMSGCGPTAAANLIWYLAGSRSRLKVLYETAERTQEAYLILMEEMFGLITPKAGGIWNPAVLAEGIRRYGETRGIALREEILRIPVRSRKHPDVEQAEAFIIRAIQRDLPAAFLNLSNGSLQNLESWHWVTIIEYDTTAKTAVISDQGVRKKISLAEWFRTSLLGGALVVMEND